MASIKNIERDIRDLEGFAVRISKDASQQSLQDYDYGRAARATFTVSDWKRARFERYYPNLNVEVLRADGRVATGTMLLAKVRASYE